MADKPSPDLEPIETWKPPGVFVNRMSMYFDGHVVRIVFLEQGSPELPPVVRNAIVMHPMVATNFAKTLQSFLASWEEQMKKAEEEAAKATKAAP